MSTSFLTASFCMAWEWGIMMFRWCDAVMQGRTAVLPLKWFYNKCWGEEIFFPHPIFA